MNNEKKISICLFILGFHNGGVEKVFDTYFSHMDRSQFDLHIVTYMDPDPAKQQIFLDMGFHVHQLSDVFGGKITPRTISEHWKLFRRYKFDIIHNNFPQNLLPLTIGRLCGIKHRILHSHSDYITMFSEKNAVVRFLYKLALRLHCLSATTLIACSALASESTFGKRRTRSGSVMILPNAIELEKFYFNEAVRKEYRKKLNLSGCFVMGHTGRFEGEHKNHAFVIQAFQALKQVQPNAKLLLIGDGPRRTEFMAAVKALGLEDSVIFTGAVLNVCDYYQAMDVFCFPSKFEGLGIVLVEAQTSGLPCVASDIVPREAFINGNVKALSLSDPIDLWVCTMRELAAQPRDADLAAIRRRGFDITANVRQLEALYLSASD